MTHLLYRCISSILVFALTLTPSATYAEFAMLPPVGTMVQTTPAFNPMLLKGLAINTENPFVFDFIVDTGDQEGLAEATLQEDAQRMVKYFLAALTVPEQDLWVNLSPYEQDRIVPDALAQTELGRDMLAQDYLLKQLSSSLTFPENELGKRFWDKVYQQAYEKYGHTDIPMNTFNKVWILPKKARVYENGGAAYVVKSDLEVMLDEDYLATQENAVNRGAYSVLRDGELRNTQYKGRDTLTSDVMREVIIPVLTEEVNQGETFAPLRQMVHALILAKWYRNTIKESLLAKAYVGQNKVGGIDLADPQAKDKIYQQYVEAYKQGVFNFIKEDYDAVTGNVVPRKYFSGGLPLHEIDYAMANRNEVRYGDLRLVKAAVTMAGASVLLTGAEAARGPSFKPERGDDKKASESEIANTARQKGVTLDRGPQTPNRMTTRALQPKEYATITYEEKGSSLRGENEPGQRFRKTVLVEREVAKPAVDESVQEVPVVETVQADATVLLMAIPDLQFSLSNLMPDISAPNVDWSWVQNKLSTAGQNTLGAFAWVWKNGPEQFKGIFSSDREVINLRTYQRVVGDQTRLIIEHDGKWYQAERVYRKSDRRTTTGSDWYLNLKEITVEERDALLEIVELDGESNRIKGVSPKQGNIRRAPLVYAGEFSLESNGNSLRGNNEVNQRFRSVEESVENVNIVSDTEAEVEVKDGFKIGRLFNWVPTFGETKEAVVSRTKKTGNALQDFGSWTWGLVPDGDKQEVQTEEVVVEKDVETSNEPGLVGKVVRGTINAPGKAVELTGEGIQAAANLGQKGIQVGENVEEKSVGAVAGVAGWAKRNTWDRLPERENLRWKFWGNNTEGRAVIAAVDQNDQRVSDDVLIAEEVEDKPGVWTVTKDKIGGAVSGTSSFVTRGAVSAYESTFGGVVAEQRLSGNDYLIEYSEPGEPFKVILKTFQGEKDNWANSESNIDVTGDFVQSILERSYDFQSDDRPFFKLEEEELLVVEERFEDNEVILGIVPQGLTEPRQLLRMTYSKPLNPLSNERTHTITEYTPIQEAVEETVAVKSFTPVSETEATIETEDSFKVSSLITTPAGVVAGGVSTGYEATTGALGNFWSWTRRHARLPQVNMSKLNVINWGIFKSTESKDTTYMAPVNETGDMIEGADAIEVTENGSNELSLKIVSPVSGSAFDINKRTRVDYQPTGEVVITAASSADNVDAVIDAVIEDLDPQVYTNARERVVVKRGLNLIPGQAKTKYIITPDISENYPWEVDMSETDIANFTTPEKQAEIAFKQIFVNEATERGYDIQTIKIDLMEAYYILTNKETGEQYQAKVTAERTGGNLFRTPKKLKFIFELVSEFDNAMNTSKTTGGIDVRDLNVGVDGQGMDIQLDDAQIQMLLEGNFTGFTPQIIQFVPITTPFAILGEAEPEESLQVAETS